MMTRGIKHEIDKFINELSAKYLPFKFKEKDCMCQVAVRPIQLWEVVFPEEHYDVMCATMFDGVNVTQHKKHQKWVTAIRKVLGVKKIKEYKMDNKMPIAREHLETIPIGFKDDYKFADGTEGL